MDCHRFVPVDQTADLSEPERLHADRPLAEPSEAGIGKKLAWQCERCHGLETGRAPDLVAHRFSECQNCHTPHGDRVATPPDCAQCHGQIELFHGAQAQTEQACRGCHTQMHASKQLAVKLCRSCHAEDQKIPAQAVFEGGHDNCTSCHQAHQFDARQAQPCQTCHSGKVTLASSKVKEHAACGNCHRPHAVAQAAASCNGCHKALANDHPPTPNASECGTCHRAHPVAGVTLADLAHSSVSTPCGDCHQQFVHDGVTHAPDVACTACHKPHRFSVKGHPRGVCRQCHADQNLLTSITPGHNECRTCHTADVHQRRNPARMCADCHALQAKEAAAGHAECRTCHEPHSAARAVTCESCHAAQRQSAPRGHQDCTSCHAPHSGSRQPTATCGSCHAAQSQGMHATTPGGCQDCHRAHGPGGQVSPPSCTSCHATNKLEALHRVRAHQNCQQCHSGHQKLVGDARENCLGCHEAQRKTHYPEAPSCSSCHLFQDL
jgi:hypothetical protein